MKRKTSLRRSKNRKFYKRCFFLILMMNEKIFMIVSALLAGACTPSIEENEKKVIDQINFALSRANSFADKGDCTTWSKGKNTYVDCKGKFFGKNYKIGFEAEWDHGEPVTSLSIVIERTDKQSKTKDRTLIDCGRTSYVWDTPDTFKSRSLACDFYLPDGRDNYMVGQQSSPSAGPHLTSEIAEKLAAKVSDLGDFAKKTSTANKVKGDLGAQLRATYGCIGEGSNSYAHGINEAIKMYVGRCLGQSRGSIRLKNGVPFEVTLDLNQEKAYVHPTAD